MSNPEVKYKEEIGWKFIYYAKRLMNICTKLLNEQTVDRKWYHKKPIFDWVYRYPVLWMGDSIFPTTVHRLYPTRGILSWWENTEYFSLAGGVCSYYVRTDQVGQILVYVWIFYRKQLA